MDITAILIAASVPSAITGFCFWLIERSIQSRAEKEKEERQARQAQVDEREKIREKSELCIINCLNPTAAILCCFHRVILPYLHCHTDHVVTLFF